MNTSEGFLHQVYLRVRKPKRRLYRQIYWSVDIKYSEKEHMAAFYDAKASNIVRYWKVALHRRGMKGGLEGNTWARRAMANRWEVR